MSDEELVRLWGRETAAHLEEIAAGIFARRGIDFALARRAGGYTNACWLAGGLALRLSTRPGSDKIRREAALAALLPAEVGYPTVLETGETAGLEWSLAEEIRGQNLGEAWPALSWAERADAFTQVWRKAEAVHQVDLACAAGLVRDRAWYNSNDPAEAAANAARLERDGAITPAHAAVLRETLERHWAALPGAQVVANHGDITPENCMWQDGRVVSLMDFEWSAAAPAALDWNTLLKWAFEPDGAPTLPMDELAGRALLRQTAAELACPALARPRDRDLLLGYAVLLELHMLCDWLDHPDGEGPVETWPPYRRLRSLLDGRGGYLAPLLG